MSSSTAVAPMLHDLRTIDPQMSDGSYHGESKRRRARSIDRNVFPTFDEIAERAYELFVAEGRRVDRVFDCWRQAENELLDRAARRVLR